PAHAVVCDRARPNCANCCRFKRRCFWYGLRLSWPRPNDRRRAVVSKTPFLFPMLSGTGSVSDARFVHTSHRDIELYHSLTRSVPVRTLTLLDVPTIWNPSELETLDHDLFDYCKLGKPHADTCRVLIGSVLCKASASLATFGHDSTALGNILGRIALQGNTKSATAVFQALLAYSSLHRYGLQFQALKLKIAALNSLAVATAGAGLDAKATIHHIVTGMLLCSFEVYQSSCTSGQWTGYLVGVKRVINVFSLERLLNFDPDVALLLEWVHYHEVLARFSLLHWKREEAPKIPSNSTDLAWSQFSTLPQLISSMLSLLSQICGVASSGKILAESGDDTDDYMGFLEVMDWRIRSLSTPMVSEDDGTAAADAALVLQLYQLAMLIYLHQTFDGRIKQTNSTQQHIDKAFELLPRLRSCKQQFPIFIIGCEAQTDEQRAIVLDAISRMERMSFSRSYTHCKGIMQAVWAQHDLSSRNRISYCDKLTSVITTCVNVPMFV
ncbi:hypothetical protein S40293_11018, partial [Stachybotrys chartarum IBT 40293]